MIQAASQKWTMPMRGWRMAMSHLIIEFGDRRDGLLCERHLHRMYVRDFRCTILFVYHFRIIKLFKRDMRKLIYNNGLLYVAFFILRAHQASLARAICQQTTKFLRSTSFLHK
ncbi:hypothetical protein Y809_08490 [Salmonella enterica subsp. enterica serovar Tennessee]|nr:hypothetical protein [Salmonella enterica subsp. enterica serovar Tennessee]EBZ9852295.1 hypothetical protein [Salmonella enterica subsp. enterica serovar Tennessee]EEK2346814.1 hypothetical protein [Salmonella enterica subsp. enterica serovar Tennessee]